MFIIAPVAIGGRAVLTLRGGRPPVFLQEIVNVRFKLPELDTRVRPPETILWTDRNLPVGELMFTRPGGQH